MLGRGPRPAFLADHVTYFHIGEGWRHAPALPEGKPAVTELPETTIVLDPADAEDVTEDFWEELKDDVFAHVLPAHDLSGRPRATLTLSSDLAEFDLLVTIYLLGDGATMIGDAVCRVQGVDSVELTFPFVSRKVAPGDRFGVRVQAPHRRYATSKAKGTVRVGLSLTLPSAAP